MRDSLKALYVKSRSKGLMQIQREALGDYQKNLELDSPVLFVTFKDLGINIGAYEQNHVRKRLQNF